MPSTGGAANESFDAGRLSRNSGGEMADRSTDGNVLSIPVPIRRGGSETNLDLDSTDGLGLGLDFHKGRLDIDNLQQKILKVTEQIKIEQTAREDNVAEYLKLIGNADKQQLSRIKQVFEKKNQKSAQTIAQLQKKLEQYHKKMRDNEANGSSKHSASKESSKETSKEPKEIFKDSLKDSLKDVSGSGRHPSVDKVKTIGPGVSLSPPFFFNKSREFANLIRNKFGSADNIAHLKSSMDTSPSFHQEVSGRSLSGSATIVAKPKYPSDDECSSGTSASADSNGNPTPGPDGSESPETQSKLTLILEDVRDIRDAQNNLGKGMESLKEQFKRDYDYIVQTLQEERYRFERLECQLNDLTELHQHETSNLKQELASIEEKVAYQAYERARDIQEVLESCQTRISKLELQQQQQQQTVQLENADAKVLLGKCINIMLALVTMVLVCVSTVAKFTAPLTRSRLHLVGTFFAVSLLALFWKNWEHLQCAVERMLLPS
ncbi:transmembrane and coiled-coil domain protein 3 isoform X1 [Brienomyrus brachyistius]|uniref:transmembrane and coiled-coil domain protein 3 isoform X1 n=1 Tax=Brienomyrus brachyistius TaxID=42636 RepID=UPI0020B274BE|nr:transmembrane and coiled-coil domain protein 3 isoform X1 [Brienomyrus brachyistius]